MGKSWMFFSIFLLVITLPLCAQVSTTVQVTPSIRNCDIGGTWYGGSDPHFQYLWTITPTSDGRYSSAIQLAADAHQFGYAAWTGWSGDIIKTGPRKYETWDISYWIWTPEAAAEWGPLLGVTIDPTLPELDIVHSKLKLVDCNTLTNTVDVYAAYYSYAGDRTPFVAPPDLDFMGGTTIVETYHRMPNLCRTVTNDGTIKSPALSPSFTYRGLKPSRR